jgi:hypothetical protein
VLLIFAYWLGDVSIATLLRETVSIDKKPEHAPWEWYPIYSLLPSDKKTEHAPWEWYPIYSLLPSDTTNKPPVYSSDFDEFVDLIGRFCKSHIQLLGVDITD